MSRLTLLPTVAALALTAPALPAVTLHVALQGNDANPGTRAKPYATLERARDAVRKLPRSGPTAVELAGGIYELKQPIEFASADSGTAEAPIEYRARKGEAVRIAGGKTVTGWQPVADPAILARLDPAARGKVQQADLKALGVTDLQGINSPQSYQSDPGLELFFRDRPMTLARYPNTGYLHIAAALDENGAPKTGIVTTPDGRFVCDDPRPAQWTGEPGAWLHGFWVWDWADV
ncbi:MAG: hypothetical protein HYU66_13470, partial [Armatimonadetes bacterium]|nr:hypothetical protein [Armatimonadota bacterium]